MEEILINGKPYAYEPYPWNYKPEFFDRQIASEFLSILKDAFDSANIRFYLNFGTLLGAIRDHDFIPHDVDMDLAMMEKDVPAFLNLLPDLEKKGVKLCRNWRTTFYTVVYKGIVCDFDVLYRPAFPYCIWFYGILEGKYIPKKYIGDMKLYNFLGNDYYVPADAEKYLVLSYGKTWRIPQKGKGANPMPKWMVLEKLFIRVKRKLRYLKCKYITHTEFK